MNILSRKQNPLLLGGVSENTHYSFCFPCVWQQGYISLVAIKATLGRALKLTLCLIAFLLISKNAATQNIYIEIRDAETYRALAGVQARLESSQATITLTSSPMGEILDNIPAGNYNILFERPGYASETLKDVVIRSQQRTTLSVSMRPESTAVAEDREEKRPEQARRKRSAQEDLSHSTESKAEIQTADGRPIHHVEESSGHEDRTFQRITQKYFIEAGYQAGPMKGFLISGSRFFSEGFYAQLMFSYSSNEYSSTFFYRPDLYSLNFMSLSAGLGYEVSFPQSDDFGYLAIPSFFAGIEAVNGKDIFPDQDLSYIMNPLLKFGLAGGVYIQNVALLLGISYNTWLSDPMTDQRVGLYRQDSEQPISWSGDLFNGREGLGLTTALRIYF